MRARLGLLVPVARSPGWSVRCRSFTALGRASDVPALLSEASCVGKKVQRFGSVVRQREAVSDSATCARQQSVSCPLVPASTSTFQGECCGGAKERCLQWMECAGVVISRPCRVYGALCMICIACWLLVRAICVVVFNTVVTYILTTTITSAIT